MAPVNWLLLVSGLLVAGTGLYLYGTYPFLALPTPWGPWPLYLLLPGAFPHDHELCVRVSLPEDHPGPALHEAAGGAVLRLGLKQFQGHCRGLRALRASRRTLGSRPIIRKKFSRAFSWPLISGYWSSGVPVTKGRER